MSNVTPIRTTQLNVPAKVEQHVYRGANIVLRYQVDTKTWSWHLIYKVTLEFDGLSASAMTALKDAKAKVDELTGGKM